MPKKKRSVPAVKLLTTREAAARIGVHHGTLNRWARTGLESIPSTTTKTGARMYRATDLDAWLKSAAGKEAAGRWLACARVKKTERALVV